MGATWFLPRLLGPQRAAAWLYTGDLVGGARATDQGLALESHPAAEVLDRALELAGRIASAAPSTIRQLRRTLAEVERLDLNETLASEAAAQAVSYGTDDLAEGLAAARERRTPRFEGR